MKDYTTIRYMFRSVEEITPEILSEIGAKGVAVDADNTTVYDARLRAIGGSKAWIDSLRAAGFPVMLVTNTFFLRAWYFAKKFGIPFQAYAAKPHTKGLRMAAKRMGIAVTQLAMVGDQVYTDVYAANKCGAIPLLVEPVENKWFWRNHYGGERKREKPIRQAFLEGTGYYVKK